MADYANRVGPTQMFFVFLLTLSLWKVMWLASRIASSHISSAYSRSLSKQEPPLTCCSPPTPHPQSWQNFLLPRRI